MVKCFFLLPLLRHDLLELFWEKVSQLLEVLLIGVWLKETLKNLRKSVSMFLVIIVSHRRGSGLPVHLIIDTVDVHCNINDLANCCGNTGRYSEHN